MCPSSRLWSVLDCGVQSAIPIPLSLDGTSFDTL